MITKDFDGFKQDVGEKLEAFDQKVGQRIKTHKVQVQNRFDLLEKDVIKIKQDSQKVGF